MNKMLFQEKIPLYYFSASGNTKYCSELVQCGFQDKNVQIELIKIKTVKNFPFPEKNKTYPAIGLAFPVYEFMVPRIIMIWLQQLPIAKHSMPVFVIDTSGGMPCNSAGLAMDLLSKKNYVPLGVLEVPTPTLEPFFKNKYYPVGWAPEILNNCYSFGLLLSERLRTGKNKFIDLRLGRFRFSFLTKYVYQYFLSGRSFSAGLIKYDAKNCNKCGMCERVCPMAAINISNSTDPIKPNRCMFCATCVRTCPNGAIKISYRKRSKLSLPKISPMIIPGYIDPKYYSKPISIKLNRSYFHLSMEMVKARKRKIIRS